MAAKLIIAIPNRIILFF